MASIERTAYPRFREWLTRDELESDYSPSTEELAFTRAHGGSPASRLSHAVLMKCFQHLGYFPNQHHVPETIVDFIRSKLVLDSNCTHLVDSSTIYRHHKRIRGYLDIETFDEQAESMATESMAELAQHRNDPADLINAAIERLVALRYELPAFRTLNDLASQVRSRANDSLYSDVAHRVPASFGEKIDGWLKGGLDRSTFERVKRLPPNATLKRMREWTEQLQWLDQFGDMEFFLNPLRIQKRECFADEARVYDAAEMKDFSQPRRFTLFLCLVWRMQREVRDQICTMLIRRMRKAKELADVKLAESVLEKEEVMVELVATLTAILTAYGSGSQITMFTQEQINQVIADHGGVDHLLEKCAHASSHHDRKALPFLSKAFATYRKAMFDVLGRLDFISTTDDSSLTDAMDLVDAYRDSSRRVLDVNLTLDFASLEWRRFVTKERGFGRRELEACVFHYLTHHLQSGDIAVRGSHFFEDYRKQLLPWEKCEPLVKSLAERAGIPGDADALVDSLRDQLTRKAEEVDRSILKNPDIEIEDGQIRLKRIRKTEVPPQAEMVKRRIANEMPERNLLDILAAVHHYTQFTRDFSPASGSDPKLKNHTFSYLLTIFAYGSGLGPAQMVRHLSRQISPHTLSYVNARHVTVDKLNSAIAHIVNVYRTMELPSLWGEESRAAADGTHIPIYTRNLLAEYHIRYGGYGGVAYHHVSDNYVALFTRFIPCGVWEAVYILDGLLENKSQIRPTVIHGDTQAQSATVFGLSYLLGIQLMPRIRQWDEMSFSRPDKNARYRNIDTIFGEAVDWNRIRTHWRDMMQVVLSVQEGRISSSLILRKLGTYSRKNKLYRAFQELGRVIRTLFLLNYMADPVLRRTITATTNKAEAFNEFCDHFRFGGSGIIQTNDPVEFEKRVKYTTLIANAVMLQNVIDMTAIVNRATAGGAGISLESLRFLAPYWTQTIKRFGEYVLDMTARPPPFETQLQLFPEQEDVG